MTDIIDRVKANGDLIRSDDGFYYFWPTKNNGMYSSADLTEIVDELNRRNAVYVPSDEDSGC